MIYINYIVIIMNYQNTTVYHNLNNIFTPSHNLDYYTYINFYNTSKYFIKTYDYLNNYHIQINILHLLLLFNLYSIINILFYYNLKKYIDYKFSKITFNYNNNLTIKRKFEDDTSYNRFFVKRNPKRKCNLKKDL